MNISNTDTDAAYDMATVIEALRAAKQFMEHRDQMNAAVHLASVRYSPATELAQRGLEAAVRVRAMLRGPASVSWSGGEGVTDVR
jgi:hypothetical protein